MKIHTLLLLLIIHNTTLQAQYIHADNLLIKGGLIFERIQEAPLNQDYVTFTRELDLKTLDPLKGMLKGALDTYDEICKKAQSQTGPLKELGLTFRPIEHGKDVLPHADLTASTLFMVTRRGQLRNSDHICRSYGARPLEIRNSADTYRIMDYCRRAEVNDIISNIAFNSHLEKWYFQSDKGSVDDQIYPNLAVQLANGTEIVTKWIGTLKPEDYKYAMDKPIFYHNCRREMSPVAKRVPYEIGPIHCEQMKPTQPKESFDEFQKALFSWTEHNCKRDQDMLSHNVLHTIKELEEVTETRNIRDSSHLMQYSDFIPMITNEVFKPSSIAVTLFQGDQPANQLTEETFVKAFNTTPKSMAQAVKTTLNITNITEKDWYKFIDNGGLKQFSTQPLTIQRDKRAIPWLAALAAGAGVGGAGYGIYYSVTDTYRTVKKAATEFVEMMDQKQTPSTPTLGQHQALVMEVSKINLNQKALKQALTLTQTEVEKYNNTRDIDLDAITAMAAELSLKQVITLSLQTFKHIMMKIANILLAAMTGKTSIYALNQEELNHIVSAYSTENPDVVLSREIAEVKTSLTGKPNEIKIQFKIPIFQAEKIFEFYHVVPIPQFSKEEPGTYLPDIDITNLAIAKKGQHYTIITDHELYKCLGTPPDCNTHFAWKQAATAPDCVMKTYMQNAPMCPAKKVSEESSPFIYFYGVTAIYSVPNATKAFVKCHSHKRNSIGKSIEMINIGQVNFEPGCTIQIIGTKQAIYYTPQDAKIVKMNDWPTFTTQIIAQNLTPIHAPTFEKTGFPTIELQEIQMPTIRDIIKGAFHPSQSLSIAVQIIAWIIGLLLLSSLIFCCYKTKCHECLWAELNKIHLQLPGKRRYAKRLQEAEKRKEAERHFRAEKNKILEQLNGRQVGPQKDITTQTLGRPILGQHKSFTRPPGIYSSNENIEQFFNRIQAIDSQLQKTDPQTKTHTLPHRFQHLVPYPTLPPLQPIQTYQPHETTVEIHQPPTEHLTTPNQDTNNQTNNQQPYNPPNSPITDPPDQLTAVRQMSLRHV